MKIADLLDVSVPSVAELARKYKTTLSAVNAELARGEKVEQEHTSDPKVARRIALAHLGERLDYYQQLAQIDEHIVASHLQSRQNPINLFKHTDRDLDNQVQIEKLSDGLDGLVIYKNDQVAAYLLVQYYDSNYWMLEGATHPMYRRQGLNSLLIDSAVKKYDRVFADMELTEDGIHSLEKYIAKTPYRVRRLNTVTGKLHDYNPADPASQDIPMYNQAVNGISRPPSAEAEHWVWGFSLDKPRHPLLSGYVYDTDIRRKPDRAILSDAKIDNMRGWGNVPDNQNVDYLGVKVFMRPSVFLKLATPLSRSDAQSADKIKQHLSQDGAIASAWLVIRIPEAWEQSDFSKPAQVVGHEGRNRMIAIQELEGDAPVETHLFFAQGLRARHITPEWVHHLNQHMLSQVNKSLVTGPLFQTSITEDTTRTTRSGAPGTLKAKISRLYGGSVTCAKAQKLKMRSGATAHDKSQANWYQNMNCGGATQVKEVFSEPAQKVAWRSHGSGDAQFWASEFQFYDWPVVIEMHPDVNQIGARFVFKNTQTHLPQNYQGWHVVFTVNGHTDVTGKLGHHAVNILTTVVSMIRGFLQDHPWDYVVFSGESGSRDKLYQAISRRLATQVGATHIQYRSDFVIYKDHMREDSAGVGLVIPGVNMPADQHPDEIRRQARKFGFKVSAQGVPPKVRSDGKY
jgi:hypothetical protein